MYKLLLFLHVLSVLIYFLLHGAVASVTFVLKRQEHPQGAEALENILDLVYRGAYLSVGTTIVSGIVLGIMGRWWQTGWIWISLGLLALIWIVMLLLGSPYVSRQFQRVYRSEAPASPTPEAAPPSTPQETTPGLLEENIPMVLTLIGVAGMAVILWLMMFKPF